MSIKIKLSSIALSVATVVSLTGAAIPLAHAQTASGLQEQITALLAQIQQLQAQLASSGGSSASVMFTSDLTLGSTGSDVTALQTWLVSKGHLVMPAGVPMGYFGNLTRAAVAKYQASAGISPSAGYFGPISRAKINTAISQTPTNTTPAQNTTTPISTVIPNSENGSLSLPTGKPIRLKIPKLNIDASMQHLGINPEGAMDIPNNVIDVGWFTGSPHPGEKGNAIITGHVAQIKGGILTKPGVFMNLNQLQPGDKLSITNDKGESIAFMVRESRLYDPAADAVDVFVAKDNGIHLNLITCEGSWNAAELSYSKRLVVFTDAIPQ